MRSHLSSLVKLVRPTYSLFFFFFNDTATTEIYTLSLHDALPISDEHRGWRDEGGRMDLRAFSLEADAWHGLDPRSLLGVRSFYAKPRGKEGRMAFPRITGVATATPAHRCAQAALLALAGYGDAQRRGFFSRSEIEGRYLYIDPATFRPDESVDGLQDRFRRGALELGEAAARGALARAGREPRDRGCLP